MIPQTINEKTVKSQGIQNSVKFGIKSSGLHHILGILRNQLYSDKVLAVIREYTCNAVDAHTEIGKSDTPIKVTLPNRMNPYFKVRDYGSALSDDDIQDVYAFYGESTKRSSNDQIGMLGIGSKAAFAYGDNFVINSHIDGEKHSYNAFIDPSQIGQIAKLDVSDSDEPDGIEIVVPVNDEDTDEFSEKAEELFKHFKVRPKIAGVQPFKYEDSPVLFSGTKWEWLDIKHDRRGYGNNRSGEAVAVMGNIGYPIDEYALNLSSENKREEHLDDLLVGNLILRVDIGELEISASREKLQYTDHTRKAIIKRLKNVQQELARTVSDGFKNAETLFDAKCLYGSTFDYGSPLYALRTVLKPKLQWKGKPVTDNEFSSHTEEKVGSGYNQTTTDTVSCDKFTQGSSRRYNASGRYKTEQAWKIECEKSTVVIENDQGHKRGIMGRILPLIINDEKKPYLIAFKNAKAKKEWLKDSGFDAPLTTLTELPKHKLSEFYTTATGGSSYEKDSKHTAKCFEFDFADAPNRSYHTKKSDFWKIADVDVENDSGVYVIIDKFCIEKKDNSGYNGSGQPTQVAHLKEHMEKIGVKFPKNIYAFKIKEREKIEGKDGWIEMHSWAKQQLEEKIANADLHQAWIDIQKIDELNRYKPNGNDSYYYGSSKVESLVSSLQRVKGKFVDAAGTLATFLGNHAEMSQTKAIRTTIKSVQEIGKQYDVEFTCPKGVKPTYDILSLYKDMLKKYEMIELIESNIWSAERRSSEVDKVANYVNVIDVCNASKKP